MAFYDWNSSPKYTKRQIDRFNEFIIGELGDNLVGIYLHGSLVMGCFNPEISDIDLLVVTNQKIELKKKRFIIKELLKMSNGPHPLEVSFLVYEAIKEWKYPTPYDLHFSEFWRHRFVADLHSDKWQKWDHEIKTDPDLAAHIMIVLTKGITLYGEDKSLIFPKVAKEDFRDSILKDFTYALNGMLEKPVYGILNSIRIYVYLLNEEILSKEEAGIWGMKHLPPKLKPLIDEIYHVYKENKKIQSKEEMIIDFKEYITKEVNRLS